MNTKAKIFIGVGIAIFLGGIAYFTKDKWMPLFTGNKGGKGDGDKTPPEGGNSGGANDSTTTNTSTKPAYPPRDAGQQGAKPSGKWATIAKGGSDNGVSVYQNIGDSWTIVTFPKFKFGKKLGEVINKTVDKSGDEWLYLKLDTPVTKDMSVFGGTFGAENKKFNNGWVNSKLVSVK